MNSKYFCLKLFYSLWCYFIPCSKIAGDGGVQSEQGPSMILTGVTYIRRPYFPTFPSSSCNVIVAFCILSKDTSEPHFSLRLYAVIFYPNLYPILIELLSHGYSESVIIEHIFKHQLVESKANPLIIASVELGFLN